MSGSRRPPGRSWRRRGASPDRRSPGKPVGSRSLCATTSATKPCNSAADDCTNDEPNMHQHRRLHRQQQHPAAPSPPCMLPVNQWYAPGRRLLHARLLGAPPTREIVASPCTAPVERPVRRASVGRFAGEAVGQSAGATALGRAIEELEGNMRGPEVGLPAAPATTTTTPPTTPRRQARRAGPEALGCVRRR